mgnify:CR=1 FL=1
MSAKNRPYDSAPPHAWWRRAIADISASNINPALRGDFEITSETRIATAGSCFAQELSKATAERGYKNYVVEKGPPGLSEENRLKFGYGLFTQHVNWYSYWTVLTDVLIRQKRRGQERPGMLILFGHSFSLKTSSLRANFSLIANSTSSVSARCSRTWMYSSLHSD